MFAPLFSPASTVIIFYPSLSFLSLPLLSFQILVHGDSVEMSRLRQALEQRYTDGSIQVATPRNCQTVEFEFRAQKIGKRIR